MSSTQIRLGLVGTLVGFACFGCLSPSGFPIYKGEHRLRKSVPAEGVLRVDATGKMTSITISGHDGLDIEVRGKVCTTASFQKRAQELAEMVRLSVERDKDGVKISPVLPGLFDPECFKIDLTIRVPWCTLAAGRPACQRTAGSRVVNVRTQSGAITIQGVDAQVNAISETGAISIRQSSGLLRLQADTGSITIDNVHGSLTARTDTGNIDVTSFAGTIDAASDTGNVTYVASTGPRTGRAIKGNTETGKITLIRRSDETRKK